MQQPNLYDRVTHADYIYKCFLHNESWIRHKVNIVNHKLRGNNKSGIRLGYVDVLSNEELYGSYQQVLITDYWLKDKNRIKDPVFEIPKSVYGIYYMPDRHWHRNIHKDFNCFINENTLIRQLWFYLLHEKDLLDRGHVSFSGQSRSSELSSLELFDLFHSQGCAQYDAAYQDLRTKIPFKNFVETDNLCDLMMSTKFSLVLETWWFRTDVLSYTEKTFRMLQTPRPWLLFHTTGSIAALKSLGFYVYDDIVDISYDSLDTASDYVPRQREILAQAQRLINLNITESMLDHWEKKTLANCEILKEYNATWKKDFEHVLSQAYDRAMLLPAKNTQS